MESFLSRNVLIVDDDELICKQLSKELARNYFETKIAYNAKTALDILDENENIDIIFIDLKLPDMHGLDMLKKVKKEHPGCEVIIITGYGNIDVAIQSLKYGATDYIEKPINMNDLSASYGRALEKLIEKEELSYRNTLLVIDDDEAIAHNLKKVLKKEGYKVFTAHSGEEGLKIIEKNKIDVVITDINMKGMDGIEVLRMAKAYYSDIEVIMVSGMKEADLSIQALRNGAIDYITKPVNLDEMFISIEKAIKIIGLKRTHLYRNRELKISSQIIAKMNEELEQKVKKRTNDLTKTQAQLFQTSKLATLGEMSAGLAHEINQPLGGIALTVSVFRKLMEMNKLTREEIDEGLTDIETSIRRITKVIDHIRTFARQDSLKFTNVEIKETIESALTLLGEQLRLHEVNVECRYSSEMPIIEGEPYQLEQVWINMITNARDALDEKDNQGEGIRKMLVISTGYQKESNTVFVSFKDNGSGVSKNNKEKVFTPFFTTKEVGKATGLGMSISYGIIEKHNGSIKLISNKNNGTEFKVILPVRVSGK